MRSTLTSKFLLAATATGLLSIYGCSSGEEPGNPFTMPTAGTGQGTAGSPASTAGSGTGGAGVGTSGSGGAMTSTGGSGGDAPQAGTGGDNVGGMSGGSAGTGGGGGGNDITKVWQSNGCGKAYNGPTGNSKISIATMGVKDANCNNKLQNGTPRCGAWGQDGSAWLTEPLMRDYYLYLPANYDPAKAYPIVFMGPGCGGNGTQVYPLNDGTAANAGNTVIRVGLTPASTDIIGHGCCPFGCFDDKEGDDSVDWVFYETLYDKLNEEICFDRNRVFASGNSSGAWFANEVACKYAGDATRPVRAPMPNTGGLPVPAAEVPTCTNAPMAGMWVHETNDPENPFTGNKVAINRAMGLNGCAAANYDAAPKENFPIGGGVANDVCKKITGCNPLYPLVVCELPGNGHGSHDNITNPGFSTFLKMFSTGDFISE